MVTVCQTGTFNTLHLGTGQGYSNLGGKRAVEAVVWCPLILAMPGRPGDPAALYADTTKVRHVEWQPEHSDLEPSVARRGRGIGLRLPIDHKKSARKYAGRSFIIYSSTVELSAGTFFRSAVVSRGLSIVR